MNMSSDEEKETKRGCRCVYCHEELVMSENPFCKPCGVTLRYCVKCDRAVERDSDVCPHCGGELDWR